jgi:tetratricopeptide (TPR) repeat protein
MGTVREACPPEEGYRLIQGITLPSGSRFDSCGPAVLAAVLQYWRDPITLHQLETAVLRFNVFGTDTRQFLAVANRRGFMGQYERGTIGRIKEAIEEGTPPILVLCIRPPTGVKLAAAALTITGVLPLFEIMGLLHAPDMTFHALVAVGYCNRTQEVVFAETQGRLRAIAYADLLPAWEQAGCFFLTLTPGTAAQLCELGEEARRRRAWRESEEFFRLGIEREPAFAPAHGARGDLYRLWGRPAEAEASYREALRLDPASVRAVNNLADLLVHQGTGLEEAVGLAERGVALAEAEWTRLLRDHDASENLDLRADLVKRLHRTLLEYLSALGTLGQARRARGDATGAIEAWRTALRLAPETMQEYRARRHCEIAEVLENGSRDEAVRHLDTASALTTDATLRRRIEEARGRLTGKR